MNLQTFWYCDERFPLDPGASEQELNATEAGLGVKLPATYRALLGISNGGIPNYSGVKLPHPSNEGEEKAIFIGGLFGTKQLKKNGEVLETWAMPLDLVLISGNCHHNIAMRYSGKGSPTVVYYETESDQLIEIAEDFDAFLEILDPEE